jgi:two-component system response regulator
MNIDGYPDTRDGGDCGSLAYVEDNDADAMMIETAIQQSGCVDDPTRFASVQSFLAHLDAVDAGEAVRPGGLLLDINLPDGSGFEILVAVRRRFGLDELPVAVFSGGGSEEEILRAYDLGANLYLHKPMEFPEYRRRVAGVCGFFKRVRNGSIRS